MVSFLFYIFGAFHVFLASEYVERYLFFLSFFISHCCRNDSESNIVHIVCISTFRLILSNIVTFSSSFGDCEGAPSIHSMFYYRTPRTSISAITTIRIDFNSFHRLVFYWFVIFPLIAGNCESVSVPATIFHTTWQPAWVTVISMNNYKFIWFLYLMPSKLVSIFSEM